ncbi:MAG TPA: tetratricopeptide repeat protein [Pirellulales bacterium]
MDRSVEQPIWSNSSGNESLRPAVAGWARAYWVWAVCGFLLLAVGLVFGQTVGHAFLGFDDNGYVFENPHVAPGLTRAGLWWALTDGPLGEWCPLTVVSHMLDCQLYGLDPAGHYLTNILLHAASSVLLFLVLLRMTGEVWPSAWVAAIFAIHPLHVESVAWVAERRDMLSGLFFMLTLGAYTLYTERPSPARYLAVAGCLALGLMAKPMLVTVPFLLLLVDYWPLDRFRRAANAGPKSTSGNWFGRLPVTWRLVVEKIPLMALAAVDCKIAMSFHLPDSTAFPIRQLSLAARLANGVVSYAIYLGQFFYPVDLAPYYPLRADLPVSWVVAAVVLLVAISAWAACCWRRRPYLLVGWLWFLGMLVPVIGLVQFGGHARADRYNYLSQIGLSIGLAWGVWSIYRSRQAVDTAPWRGWTLAAVSGGAVFALAGVAWHQTSYWRNAETLWRHTIACTERNSMARYNLAFVYAREGRTEEAISQLRDVAAADSIDPQVMEESQALLAESLTKLGRTDEALAQYGQAVRAYPKSATAHDRLAAAFGRAGKHEQAIAEWRETLRLAPTYLQPRLGIANALLADGKASEAVAECRALLTRQPDSTEGLILLGLGLALNGELEDAIAQFEHAVKVEPHNARAHFVLGLALYDLDRSGGALAHLNEALLLQPDNVQILWQVAWILATSPDSAVRAGTRAVDLAGRAIRLSGGEEPHAFDAMAAALAETQDFSAAIEAADRASALALARNDNALVDAIEQRARLYRQRLPYRQAPSPPPKKRAPPQSPE